MSKFMVSIYFSAFIEHCKRSTTVSDFGLYTTCFVLPFDVRVNTYGIQNICTQTAVMEGHTR